MISAQLTPQLLRLHGRRAARSAGAGRHLPVGFPYLLLLFITRLFGKAMAQGVE